jgi:broad specificity phosphatase PhoE
MRNPEVTRTEERRSSERSAAIDHARRERRSAGRCSVALAVWTALAATTLQAGDPRLIPNVSRAEGTTVVVLVRHAEKGATPPADPPLTDAGRARADALVTVLENARVDAIITTQYERSRKTAEPLAAAQRVTPMVVHAGDDTAAHARDVADVVGRQPAGRLVVIVGHSNTLPAIVRALGGPALPDLCDAEYATLLTLIIAPNGPSRLLRSSYGAPDPPEPCGRTMVR